MGTYYIPRNYKGETRILYIFSVKSLITTAIGAMFGGIFFAIFKMMNMNTPAWVALAIFAVIGWAARGIKNTDHCCYSYN